MKSPIRIPNWLKFQHYKRRSPPWIKLHREILDDPQWAILSGDAAKLLVELWLLASESKDGDGTIVTPTAALAWRLRRPVEVFVPLLLELQKAERIELAVGDASTVLALCQQAATPEVEVEERQRKPTAAVGSDKPIEHTISSLALEANAVLGMGLWWKSELSPAFGATKEIIRRTWDGSGVGLDGVYAAIHGLRKMVDRGDVEWLADRKGKPLDGIHCLVNSKAVIPGPDGTQLRPLFTAAAEAYYRDDPPTRTAKSGNPQRLEVRLPDGPQGGAAA